MCLCILDGVAADRTPGTVQFLHQEQAVGTCVVQWSRC